MTLTIDEAIERRDQIDIDDHAEGYHEAESLPGCPTCDAMYESEGSE